VARAVVRVIYSNKIFKEKPLTVLRSCLAVLLMTSASSRVHRMRIADLPDSIWHFLAEYEVEHSLGMLG
jgi:hypothetical protein